MDVLLYCANMCQTSSLGIHCNCIISQITAWGCSHVMLYNGGRGGGIRISAYLASKVLKTLGCRTLQGSMRSKML